ncbi:MAG TPA: hypothetical protein ENN69_01795 [Spirochaetia bacterium]|nr:hypothetical protein [Spirochaetia bacterium]
MTHGTKHRLFVLGNILFFLGMVTVNGLANAIPIGGRTTGRISDGIPNLFVPAGLTFSIWGVIYLLLLVFVVWQARGLIRREERLHQMLSRIGPFFILSSALNATWIFAWHFLLIGLSLAIMFALLVTLLALYLRLRIGRERVKLSEKICGHLPFSVYLGWITVATIANVTAVLVTNGWDGFGLSERFWTVLMIGTAILIALTSLVTRRDIPFALVIAWALFGIYLKRTSPELVLVPEVACGALAGMIIVLAGSVGTLVRVLLRPRRIPEKTT